MTDSHDPTERPIDPNEWITIEMARAIVRVSRRTIYNWVEAGRLDTRRTVGGSIRIRAGSLWRA